MKDYRQLWKKLCKRAARKTPMVAPAGTIEIGALKINGEGRGRVDFVLTYRRMDGQIVNKNYMFLDRGDSLQVPWLTVSDERVK